MSHVAMEEKVCQVCGVKHSHNCGILLHKRLGNIQDDQRVTGFALCEEHDKLHKDGFVCLVAVEPVAEGVTHLKEENVTRTGALAHIKREVFANMVNSPIGDTEIVYVEEDVMNIIKGFAAEAVQSK